MNAFAQTAVLIPAYQPDERLITYVHALCDEGAGLIVVVNDGSSSACDQCFAQVQAIENTHVIQYAPNKGKGVALRTGLEWIMNHTDAERIRTIVTADADGQHKVADVIRVSECVCEDKSSLWLGSRDFSLPNVPMKSRKGNRITSTVFKLLYGQWVCDTQTGLRGFDRAYLPMMCKTEGDRYEYEMKVLIDCTRNNIQMKPVSIETVYENNNEGSHFRAFRDSFRIYRVILGQFVKFAASSIVSFLVDYGLFLLLNWLLERFCPQLDYAVRILVLQFMLRITIATAGARVVSCTVNYLLNRSIVFKSKHNKGSFFRFCCVVILNLVLSAGFTSTFHMLFGVKEQIVKLPVDLLLFLLSYMLQQRWVFKKKKG